MKPTLLVRVVAGLSVAVPVVIIITGAALAMGASSLFATLCGAGTGAVCGILVQQVVTEGEEK